MKKILYGFFLLFIISHRNAYADPTEQTNINEAHAKLSGMEIEYWLYTPETVSGDMPLIVYLHGGTSKGNDLDLLIKREGFPQYVIQGKLNIPAYVIMPQAPEEIRSWNEIGNQIVELAAITVDQYPIDSGKISLTGHSMGGIGTWEIGFAHKDFFSRIAPLSGTISKRLQSAISELTIPVWSIIGSDPSDQNAFSSNTSIFPQIEKNNPNARLTIMEGAKHWEVVKAYLQYDIINWLIGSDTQ